MVGGYQERDFVRQVDDNNKTVPICVQLFPQRQQANGEQFFWLCIRRSVEKEGKPYFC